MTDHLPRRVVKLDRPSLIEMGRAVAPHVEGDENLVAVGMLVVNFRTQAVETLRLAESSELVLVGEIDGDTEVFRRAVWAATLLAFFEGDEVHPMILRIRDSLRRVTNHVDG